MSSSSSLGKYSDGGDAETPLVSFSHGEVVIYGDKEEAELDCYGNESVTKCIDLPEHHQEALKKQIEKYY